MQLLFVLYAFFTALAFSQGDNGAVGAEQFDGQAGRLVSSKASKAMDSADLVQLSLGSSPTRRASKEEDEDDEDDEEDDEEDEGEMEACAVLEASGDCEERSDCVWNKVPSRCEDGEEDEEEDDEDDEEENLGTVLDEGLIADVYGTELELREGHPKAFRKDQVMLETLHGPSHIKGPCAFEGDGDEDNCRPMWRHSKYHRGIKDSFTHWPDGRLMLRNRWGRPRRATLQDFATNHYDEDVRNRAREILAERGQTVNHAEGWMTPDKRRNEFEATQRHYAEFKELSPEQRLQKHREGMKVDHMPLLEEA